MNSIGIETFLNATQAAPKAKPLASSEGAGEFNDYLREAANTQQQPAKEKPVAKAKANDAPVPSTSQEQDSTRSSDEQANSTVESAEHVDKVAEEQPADEATDEVLLSAAAIAASSAEVMPLTTVPEVDLEVAIETAAVDASQTPSAPESVTAQDFLPNQALAKNANSIGGQAAPTELIVPIEQASNDQATTPLSTEAFTQEAATSPADAQEQVVAPTAQSTKQTPAIQTTAVQSKQAIAETAAKSEGEAEKSDASERKATKSTAADKHGVAEQLVAALAATIADSDLTQDTKLQAAADTGSSVSEIRADAQAQQQPQAKELARADAQTLQGDIDSRMPTIDRARFVQRVANAFRSAQQNDGHIQMRLSPPELGSLRIEIAVRHGVLSANLETETADARRVLLDNLPALRQRLAEQDIRIEKFDVDVRREGSQSDGQAGAQDRQTQQQSQRAAAQNRIRTSTTPEVISARVPRPHTASADTGLDVRI